MRLASDNEQNPGHEGENGKHEVVVGKREVDKPEERPQQKPKAEKAETKVASRGGHGSDRIFGGKNVRSRQR